MREFADTYIAWQPLPEPYQEGENGGTAFKVLSTHLFLGKDPGLDARCEICGLEYGEHITASLSVDEKQFTNHSI